MNSLDEFLEKLKLKLSNLSEDEIEKILTYYKECINDMVDDGLSEEEILNSFGDINEIIKNIEIEINDNKGKSSSDKRVKKIYKFNGDYKSLNVFDVNSPIKIIATESEEVELTVFESGNEYYEVEESDELNISYTNEFGFFGRLFAFFSFTNKFFMEIKIPKNMLLNVKTTCKNNNIEILDINVNTLEVYNRNGKNIVKNIVAKNDVIIKNTNGENNIEALKAENFKVKTVNGATNISDIIVEKQVFCESVNGKMSVYGLDFNEKADFKNVNGATSLDLKGETDDFTFDISSVNGKLKVNNNNVKDEGSIYFSKGNKIVKIKSVNGAIKLNLVK